MRIAVKSAGGITEAFIHVGNAGEGAKEAARQIAEDYALPTDIELWSDNPDGGPARKLGTPLRRRGRKRQRRGTRLSPPIAPRRAPGAANGSPPPSRPSDARRQGQAPFGGGASRRP